MNIQIVVKYTLSDFTGSWPLGTSIGQDRPNDQSTLPKLAGIASCPTTISLAYSAIILVLFLAFI
jgi:hypothetical protein